MKKRNYKSVKDTNDFALQLKRALDKQQDLRAVGMLTHAFAELASEQIEGFDHNDFVSLVMTGEPFEPHLTVVDAKEMPHTAASKYAPKNPIITFVRYEHFAYTGQKFHAMSPKHGDKRFATYREAWEWLHSLTCDSFASYTYDKMVCANCGGHPWNHNAPCSCVKVADSEVKWTCELNGCDCIVHGCSGIAQTCPMCLSVLGMGYDGLTVLWVCPDCPWFAVRGERLVEEVTK